VRRGGLVLLTLLAGIMTVKGQGTAVCLKANAEGQVAEGRVRSGCFTDFAGRTEQAFILQLARPTCLSGDDEYDKVDRSDRIHIFSMDPTMRQKIRAAVGKIVRVKGTPFGEHTVYHHAPIVMPVSEIEPVR
jgi:hypothetical protein